MTAKKGEAANRPRPFSFSAIPVFWFICIVRPFFICILLLLCIAASAQDYNYIHYDVKDGLPGSTVYRICQDKKGYLWFATDNGASMFDGKKFINFTTDDGLTDNEILHVATDSKGRVWMTPFDKTACYYYEGKIHSARNDSMLKNIRFTSQAMAAGENEQGEIYFFSTDGIFILKKSGQLKTIADFDKMSRQYGSPKTHFLTLYRPDLYKQGVAVLNGPRVFVSVNDSLVFLKNIPTNEAGRNDLYRIGKDLKLYYVKHSFLKAYKSLSLLGDYIVYNTTNGAWRVDSLGNLDTIPFLPGKNISYSFLDNEGNTWFATLGEGIYRLTSGSMKTFSRTQESFCIGKTNSRIHAGLADGRVLVIKDQQLEETYPFRPVFGQPSSKRLYTLKTDPDGTVYMGYDVYLAKQHKDKTIYSPVFPIKSIDIIDENYIVVCTNMVTVRMRVTDLAIVDTLWHERGTKVIYNKGSYYIGTLQGLVIINPDRTITRTADHIPQLNKRIVDLCKIPDGGIWVATNDNGVLLYKNGRVETVINTSSGLSSNTCKSLFLKDRYLWISTNKGLNKLDIDNKKVVTRYSTADGLPSDIINTVYIEDSTIWVGSPAGLTYFKETDIAATSICLLDLHSAYVSGEKADINNYLQLPWNNNNISFDYAAISFKSAGDIVYHYKLSGLDGDWKQTRLTTLAYPSLPPGDYKLELYAVNKFGRQSPTAVVRFSIAAPFWKTVWFWLASVAFAAGIIWYFINRRYKLLQQKAKEKNEIERRMKELEQASLRAQMNPHFIFNCLNSIQAFIIKNDIAQTNKYITQFGNLIRQTLDNSARANIPVSDELVYLTSYMELERMRFTAKFKYIINVDPAIHADYVFIPSMILQPFIENAIRHGIRNKKDGEGTITISISQTAEAMIFSIEDNGIGRQAAMRYKSMQHIEYQSKGITLTQNRLELLNSMNNEKITTEIIDLADEAGQPAGTRVVIVFPRTVIEMLD